LPEAYQSPFRFEAIDYRRTEVDPLRGFGKHIEAPERVWLIPTGYRSFDPTDRAGENKQVGVECVDGATERIILSIPGSSLP
jgi:hypothetical protein